MEKYELELMGKDINVAEGVCSAEHLNSMFRKVCLVLQQLEERMLKPERYGKMKLEEMFANQAINFALDLAAADGVMAQKEAGFINQIFGLEYTSAEYARFWKDYDDRAVHKGAVRNYFVPAVYYAAVAADNGMYEGQEVCRHAVLKFFVELAKAIVAVDGKIDPQEQESLESFVFALETSAKDGAKGFLFIKDDGDIQL